MWYDRKFLWTNLLCFSYRFGDVTSRNGWIYLEPYGQKCKGQYMDQGKCFRKTCTNLGYPASIAQCYKTTNDLFSFQVDNTYCGARKGGSTDKPKGIICS